MADSIYKISWFLFKLRLSVAVSMTVPPVDAIVIKDVVRPRRGAGFWTDRHIAKSLTLEVMKARTLLKMDKLLDKNTQRMEVLKTNPLKHGKVLSVWKELFLLEESRQHCVKEEEQYRDERDDGGPDLAGDLEVDAWNTWTMHVHRCTLKWERAIRREKIYRIRLLQKQLELLHVGLLDMRRNGFTSWAYKEMGQFGLAIKNDFDNLDYCPEDKMVKLMDLVEMPVWLSTTRNMWSMEGLRYSEL